MNSKSIAQLWQGAVCQPIWHLLLFVMASVTIGFKLAEHPGTMYSPAFRWLAIWALIVFVHAILVYFLSREAGRPSRTLIIGALIIMLLWELEFIFVRPPQITFAQGAVMDSTRIVHLVVLWGTFFTGFFVCLQHLTRQIRIPESKIKKGL